MPALVADPPKSSGSPTAVAAALAVPLRRAGRRLFRANLVQGICASALRAGTLLLLAGGVAHLLLDRPPLGMPLVVAAALFFLADVALHAWRGRRSLGAIAAELDRRAGTRDRFSTALTLDAKRAGDAAGLAPLETLALAECERFITRFPVEHWTPVRLPRARLLALLAPLVSLGLLAWHHAAIQRDRAAAQDPALVQTVSSQAEELQKLADALRQQNAAPPPDLAKLAAELEAAVQRLREAAAPGQDSEAGRKAALRELSALQEKLAQMKEAARGQRPSSAEVAALAAALERAAATQPAAEALRAGDLASAAEQLEKLLQQLKENGDPTKALEQLARAMQENAARLSEEEKTEVARQMQSAAAAAQAGQSGLSAQAMRRLAELLRRAAAAAGKEGGSSSPQTQGRAGTGRQLTAQELQSLLNALEAMKDNLRPGGSGGGKPGDGPGLGLMFQDFAGAKKPGGNPAPDDANGASGLPGSDRDTGTGGEIAGERADPTAAAGRQGTTTRIQGELTDSGEATDGLLLPTADGPGASGTRASRRYRELYEAMEPAAQEALRQEEIPLGSRVFVGRYFKSIRPPD